MDLGGSTNVLIHVIIEAIQGALLFARRPERIALMQFLGQKNQTINKQGSVLSGVFADLPDGIRTALEERRDRDRRRVRLLRRLLLWRLAVCGRGCC